MPKIQKEPNMVSSGSASPRTGQNEVPDMIQESKELNRKIASMRDLNPKMKNALNKIDSQIEHIKDTTKEWDQHKPFPMEEFQQQSTDYRGEGLLPEDQITGVRVHNSARIKERNHPAGKVYEK